MDIVEIPTIKGRLLITWLNMFQSCHNQEITGLSQWCWPNGGSYFDQPVYLPQLFNLFRQQIAIALKQKTSSIKNR